MQPEQQQPQMYGPSQPIQTGSDGPNKKKPIIIGIVVLVVIIIVASVLAMMGSKSKKKNDTSSDNSLYHFRDGYDIKQYGSDIGDPMALTMDKHAPANGSIVDACNVLTIKDLNGIKAYVQPRADDRGVRRNYIDGVGKQAPELDSYSLPLREEANTCDYSMQPEGILELSVYQPPYASKEALTYQLDRYYSQVASVGGLTTYKDKDNDTDKTSKRFMLVSGDNALEVLFNGMKVSDATQNTILDLAAKHFSAELQSPQGPAIAAYDTPTFKKPYAIACNLISNEDVKTLTGSDASIYATEGLATGTSVEKVQEKLYNSISTSCSRFNTGIGSGIGAGAFDHQLDVTVTSYNDAAAPEYYIQNTGKDLSEKESVTFGDGGLGYKDSAGQNTVLFRQGRFIVELVYDRTLQDKDNLSSVSAMNQTLAPLAQKIANNLKPMQ